MFTKIAPFPPSEILGGGWLVFDTKHGIDGLMRIKGFELELLAVHAAEPGTGQFRRFIAEAKGKYDAISVWAISNPDLPGMLKRYGFVEATDVEPDGDKLEGFRWDSSD